MNRILIVLAVAGLVCGCANYKYSLQPMYRNGAVGMAIATSDEPIEAQPPVVTAANGDPNDITGYVMTKTEVPLTFEQKLLRWGIGLGGTITAGLVGQNNEWFKFESSQKDSPPPVVYEIHGNDQVNVASGNSGAVNQSNDNKVEGE